MKTIFLSFILFFSYSARAEVCDKNNIVYNNSSSLFGSDESFSVPFSVNGHNECWKQKASLEMSIDYKQVGENSSTGRIKVSLPETKFSDSTGSTQSYLNLSKEEGTQGTYRLSILSTTCYQEEVLSSQAIEGLFVINDSITISDFSKRLQNIPASEAFDDSGISAISTQNRSAVSVLSSFDLNGQSKASHENDNGTVIIASGAAAEILAKSMAQTHESSFSFPFFQVGGYVPEVFAAYFGQQVGEQKLTSDLHISSVLFSNSARTKNFSLNTFLHTVYNPSYVCTKEFQSYMKDSQIGNVSTAQFPQLKVKQRSDSVEIRW